MNIVFGKYEELIKFYVQFIYRVYCITVLMIKD